MRYEKEHGGGGVGGNVKYPWVCAQEGKRIYFIFYLSKADGSLGKLCGLRAPTACSSRILLLVSPWTPAARAFLGLSSEAEHEYHPFKNNNKNAYCCTALNL